MRDWRQEHAKVPRVFPDCRAPGGFHMRYLKYLGLMAVIALFVAFAKPSQAQVSFGVGVGVPAYPAPVYAAPPVDMPYGYPPDCPYGYYNYAPYACAPYGYYGPNWFVDGLFIGVGPWYGWGYRGWGWGHGGWTWGRGGYGYGPHPGYGFRGGAAFRGGEGYRGGYAAGVRGSYAGATRGYVGGGHAFAG